MILLALCLIWFYCEKISDNCSLYFQRNKKSHSDRKQKISVALDSTLSDFTAVCRPKKLRIVHSSTANKRITRASLSSKANAVKTPRRTTRRTKRNLSYAETNETDNEREAVAVSYRFQCLV